MGDVPFAMRSAHCHTQVEFLYFDASELSAEVKLKCALIILFQLCREVSR